MKTSLGSYSIYRQAQAGAAGPWVRKWVVRFFVGGDKPLTRSKHPFLICDKCLAEVGNPVETRANCGCQKKVKDWAELFLRTHTAMLQRGEMDRLTELLMPKKWTPVSEVLAVYRERGPDDRAQRLNFLATVFEQTTGRDISCLRWEDLTADLKLDWAELRQEAGRRGWLGLGAGKNMPDGGWALLRDLKRAGKLPALDDRTEAPWNTTVNTYMTSINSVFGEKARTKVLRGLHVPPLAEFLGCRLALPAPKGHREIEAEVMRRIVAELPTLRAECPQVGAFVLVCAWLSGRPGKVLELKGEALKVLADGTGIITQPAAKGGNDSFTMVDAECVGALLALRTPESLFGVRHETEAKKVLKDANAWLDGLGMEGTKKMSMFRHHKLNLLRNTLGDEVAASAAGHTSAAMVRSTYTRNEKVVPLVNPFERVA